MPNDNRRQSLINRINNLRRQIAEKKATILRIKQKSSEINSSDRNSIAMLERHIANFETQIISLQSELDKL